MKNFRLTQVPGGFTLTELAIVLVIVALLSGGLIVSLSAQRDLQNYADTTRQLNEISEALLGFATANGRLPRPAVSATDGTEKSSCTSDANCTGFIPWQILGVRKSDSWGKLIRYSVTPAFTDPFSLLTSTSKKIFSRNSGGNPIYLVGQASTCSTSNPCAPVVIYSHGKHRFGTDDSGNALPGGSATSLDEAGNDTGSAVSGTPGTQFITRTYTENTAVTGGEFDDIVIWLSPNVLYNRMIAAGRLP